MAPFSPWLADPSEELADPMDGGFPEQDLEEHSSSAHRDPDGDDRDVLEQYAER
jgi:hypothetical protein